MLETEVQRLYSRFREALFDRKAQKYAKALNDRESLFFIYKSGSFFV